MLSKEKGPVAEHIDALEKHIRDMYEELVKEFHENKLNTRALDDSQMKMKGLQTDIRGLTTSVRTKEREIKAFQHQLTTIINYVDPKDYEDSIRIEHVAMFGWLNAQNASKLNKLKFQDLRVELIGPEYKAWQFGDENSENSIKGSAGDWCRVVTGRLSKNSTPTLTTEGEFASKFVKMNHVKI